MDHHRFNWNQEIQKDLLAIDLHIKQWYTIVLSSYKQTKAHRNFALRMRN